MGTSSSKQAQHQQAPESPAAGFTCEICIEPMTIGQRFHNGTLCSHPFCVDCVVKYVTVKVNEYRSADVACPGLGCPHLLDPLSFCSVLPPEVFATWCDVLCDKAILGFDGHCYCPNRDCAELVVSECGKNIKRSVCPKCKKPFCFNCKMTWHAGYRCEESREMRDRNDVAFGVLVETNKWMRCPVCHHCIERIEGCNIIMCRCGTEFCYKCGKKVKDHWCECNTIRCRAFCCKVCSFFIVIILFFTLLWILVNTRP